ncbi:MAG TPA: hypothetical protein VIZ44_08150 [Gaiellaceae bacterium]
MTGPHSLLEDYFKLVLGDPEGDRDFLVERSPKTHIGDIACPLLTIQGRNHRASSSVSRTTSWAS